MIEIKYTAPGPEAARFIADDTSLFAGLRGPFGSGKSVAACIKLAMLALNQPESPRDGIRKSRTLIVRNTNPQLRTTTIKTWLDWFPEDVFGRFRWSPPFTHHWRLPGIDAEFIFLPMDGEDSMRSLLSFEISAIWFNEARELDKSVIDAGMGRLGRYPSIRDGGVRQKMGLADTNSPSEEHWWPIMAGDVPPPEWMPEEDRLTLVKPDGWTFYSQPPAVLARYEGEGRNRRLVGYDVNPDAENLANVGPAYYRDMLPGKSADWIKVYLMNRYGALHFGRPVYENTYDPDVHEMEDIWPDRGARIRVGLDFGLTPAATWWVWLGGMQWVVFDEKVYARGSAKDLADHIKMQRQKLPEADISIMGDPGGKAGGQGEGSSAFDILSANGVFAEPAPSNDTELREGAVNYLLTTMTRGKPNMRICKRCVNLRAAMAGAYRRDTKRHKGDAQDTMLVAPVKNQASHVAEAAQYGAMHTGAFEQVIGVSESAMAPKVARGTERRARGRVLRDRERQSRRRPA